MAAPAAVRFRSAVDPASGNLPYEVEDRANGTALDAALGLRAAAFRQGRSDRDAHDDGFSHLVVRSAGDCAICATFRYRVTDGSGASSGYAAQFYDLDQRFRSFGTVVEVGRLCVADGAARPDVLRVLFAGLARVVLRSRADLIFGCASFPGAAVALHEKALETLFASHLLPAQLQVRAYNPLRLDTGSQGALALPPLLRAYLAMGAGVGPDAVLDPVLDTLHVFAALDPRSVPLARRRTLLALAARL